MLGSFGKKVLKDSNTTLVKVKCFMDVYMTAMVINSNTTLVKVK